MCLPQADFPIECVLNQHRLCLQCRQTQIFSKTKCKFGLRLFRKLPIIKYTKNGMRCDPVPSLLHFFLSTGVRSACMYICSFRFICSTLASLRPATYDHTKMSQEPTFIRANRKKTCYLFDAKICRGNFLLNLLISKAIASFHSLFNFACSYPLYELNTADFEI